MSSVTNLTPLPTAPTPETNLSLLPDASYNSANSVFSRINLSCLSSLLEGYPTSLVNFLISGFSFGFRIGFLGKVSFGREKNNLSANENVGDVSKAILKELHRGHTMGPFTTPPFSPFTCSPLGAVPKKDGTLRIILDLSSPIGTSVNDGIPPEFFKVKYSSFDDAVGMVRDLGSGCYMAKIDIKHAFRLCPVHPDDWPLLGFKWLGKYFFDICLPFGSRSSPFIFNTFADALAWILIHKFGVTLIIHYLDDFFVCASTFIECQRKVDLVLQLFKRLGVPVAEDKLEGPSKRIVFLGIEIDSDSLCIRLPADKLSSLSVSISSWQHRKKCTKVELLSLIGSLSFACKVVKPGRIFLRRLIDLSTTVNKLHHHIDITSSVRLDLKMWSNLLSFWNGTSVIQHPPISSSDLNLFTDASFKGFGAYFNGSWISSPWLFQVSCHHIATLELFAVYAALFIWSDRLRDRQIVIYSDNIAIVQVWESGSSKDKHIMKLVRLLFFRCINFNISLSLRHLSGCHNIYADLLSRLQVPQFLEQCQDAQDLPTVIPPSTWDFFTTD